MLPCPSDTFLDLTDPRQTNWSLSSVGRHTSETRIEAEEKTSADFRVLATPQDKAAEAPRGLQP